ncbi:MAG TPA: sensor domain-containing diguanylate cyclase [Candidatus Limnocylindrales bacterium]|nr:sensor domain-containing diguanylate cyclase [Candidatus Limnocylindrales bacterium]
MTAISVAESFAAAAIRPSQLRSDRLLSSAVDLVRTGLGARRASGMLVDVEAQEVWVKKMYAEGVEARASRQRARVGEGVAGYVAETGRALVLTDIRDHPRFAGGTRRSGYETPSLLSVPVVIQGQVRAVLNASDRLDGRPFDERDVAFMSGLARHVALCLEYGLFERRARAQAMTDALTGLLNRRYFEERLAREVARARRRGGGLALLMLDLNEFKAFNDSYGHVEGDRVLAEAARVVRDVVGRRGIVCRYGGDEFTVLLPDRSRAEAERIAHEIEEGIAEHRFAGGARGLRLTISIGISAVAGDVKTAQDLVGGADSAMYERKWQMTRRPGHPLELERPAAG